MHVATRRYTLPNNHTSHAYISIIPTGELDVLLPQAQRHYRGEFASLVFRMRNKLCYLHCQGNANNACWDLVLADKDGSELAYMVTAAQEEFEALMRDL